jgi:hypothetical protein
VAVHDGEPVTVVAADVDLRAVVQLIDPLEVGSRAGLHVEEAVAI